MIERWKQHFYKHLNSVQEGDHDNEGSDYVGAVNDGDMPPLTLGEVKDATKQLNKSTDVDMFDDIIFETLLAEPEQSTTGKSRQ